MFLNECYKIYSCLITPLQRGIEKVINNITIGYTLLGDKVFEYIFDKDLIDFKGCFIEENHKYFSGLEEIIKSQNYSHNSLIKTVCKESSAQLIALMQDTVHQTMNMPQKYAIGGTFSANLNTSIANLFNETFIVTNNVFTFNNESAFLGIIDNLHCSMEYIKENFFPYSIKEILEFYPQTNISKVFSNVPLNMVHNITSFYNGSINPSSSDNTKTNSENIISNIVMPIIQVVTLILPFVIGGSIYCIYKKCGSDNNSAKYLLTSVNTNTEEADIIQAIINNENNEAKFVIINVDNKDDPHNLVGEPSNFIDNSEGVHT